MALDLRNRPLGRIETDGGGFRDITRIQIQPGIPDWVRVTVESSAASSGGGDVTEYLSLPVGVVLDLARAAGVFTPRDVD